MLPVSRKFSITEHHGFHRLLDCEQNCNKKYKISQSLLHFFCRTRKGSLWASASASNIMRALCWDWAWELRQSCGKV
jgi:hypothetical protein